MTNARTTVGIELVEPSGTYGVGTNIGGGLGITAGHVVYQIVVGGSTTPGSRLLTTDFQVTPQQGAKNFLEDQTGAAENYEATIHNVITQSVNYYNNWYANYNAWLKLYRAYQADPSKPLPTFQSPSGPCPYRQTSSKPPAGTLVDCTGAALLSTSSDPTKIYNLLEKPTAAGILSNPSLISMDSVLYSTKSNKAAAGTVFLYNSADLNSIASLLFGGTTSFQSFQFGPGGVQGDAFTSALAFTDVTGEKFHFKLTGSPPVDVGHGNSGSPIVLDYNGSAYVLGVLSAAPGKSKVIATGNGCTTTVNALNNNGEVATDNTRPNTGIMFNRNSFDSLNNVSTKNPASLPVNLIIGVDHKAASAATSGFGVAEGTLHRDQFIGTSGKEYFKASGGDTVRVGSDENIVILDPKADPGLRGDMTVQFGKTASGQDSGDTVVVVTPGAGNDYVLDLSSDPSITPENIDLIAGGQSLYWYPGAPDVASTPDEIMKNAHVEFLSVKIGGHYITFMNDNESVGIATTAHDGLFAAKSRSPITRILFARQPDPSSPGKMLPGRSMSVDDIYKRIHDLAIQTQGENLAFAQAYSSPVGTQLDEFSDYFAPDPLNSAGKSSVALNLTSPPPIGAAPRLTDLLGPTLDIVVTGQSGTGGGGEGQSSGDSDPYGLYATGPGQILDPAGTYSTVYGEGGGDTFVFNQGYGQVLIEEADTAASPHNSLQLGSGITTANTTVSADDSGDITLDFGNGNSVVLAGELLSADGAAYGVQLVQFADGTAWTYADLLGQLETPSAEHPILYGDASANTLDGAGVSSTLEGFGGGDTFILNKGYGALAIEEKDSSANPNNVLVLGPGLTPDNATVSADSNGMITIDFGGGDQVWLVGQLNSGGGVTYGVQQIQFANGTVWTEADLVSQLDVVSSNSTTLYGDDSGHIFDTQGIDNAIVSRGGGDTIVYNQGYGALTISETDLGVDPHNVLQLGPGITAAGTSFTRNSGGDLILDFGNGDSITLVNAFNNGYKTAYGVQTINFYDGAVWHYSDLLAAVDTPSALNTTLYGDAKANTLDGEGVATTLVGNGGGDTFIFNQGYGELTIAEDDLSNTPNNVLRIGAGLDVSALHVTGDSDGNVILSFGSADRIVLLNALLSANGEAYGVQHVVFADGTTISANDLLTLAETPSASQTTLYGDRGANVLDGLGIAHNLIGGGGGDTFIFKRGYGHLAIDEGDVTSAPSNALQLGLGFSSTELTVTADASGNLILDFGGGDQITLIGALNSTGSVTRGLQQVNFEDGSFLTYAQLLAKADTPSATNTILYGDTGANVLNGQGVAHALIGNGGGDTFIFNQGYGTLTIAENDPYVGDSNTLQLGAGLLPASTLVTADASGDLILDFGGGDVVNIQGALDARTDASDGVQQVKFADGTIWNYAQMLAFADTGSINNTALYGDGRGDTFDTKGFARTINSAGGEDTIIYNQGYGALTVNEADTSGNADNTLVLGAGLSKSNITVSSDVNNSIILTFGGGDVITLTAAMQRSDTTAYGVQNIQFADGSLWTLADLRYQINPTSAGMVNVGGDFSETVDKDVLDGGGHASGFLQFTDSNTSDAHDVSVVSVAASGDVPSSLTNSQLLGFLQAYIGTDTSGNNSGFINWRFSGPGAFDYLQPNQSVTLNYVVAVSDGEGGELRQDVTILVTGSQSGDSQLTLYGSDLTINYELGRGDLYINDVAGITDPNNTLAFGVGIDPSMVTVKALTDPQATADSLLDSLQLVVAGSGTITLADALSDPTAGVKKVTFADGTVWTYAQIVAMLGLQHPQGYPYNGKAVAVGGIGADVLDPQGVAHIAEGNGGGDTFVYKRGYGALDIIENDTTVSTNTLAFGAGISTSDVTVTMAGIDQFKLSLGNGDVVTFVGSGGGLSNSSYWDANSSISVPVTNAYTGVEAITFADGTVWTVAQLVEQQVANSGILYGTEGLDIFDSKGIATEIDGAGGADAIIYKQGYGALTIHDSGQGATLKLGSGLNPGNLALSQNGSDVVLSFGGADTITLSGESDGNGVDTIVFGNGIVWDRSDIAVHETHDILGTIWNDTLFGTAGNDTLNGGAGNDTLDGGDGSDTYVFAPGDGQDVINDVRGSGISNVVQFGSGIAPGDIYVYTANSGSDIVLGRIDSTDTVTISAMNSDTTKGVDEVHFADGTVWSYADIMARRTSFTTGNDTITGTSGNETLYGAAGDDILQGRAGNDVLDGGTGNDTLYGGDGDDVYRFAAGDGQDLVADFPSGSGTGGIDTIQLGAGILPANVSVTQANNGADLVLNFAGSNDQITLSNAINSSLWRIEQVTFADGTNWSYSDLMAKATTPTSGNDIIYGDESNQTLSGGSGDDKLYGARGDDTLIGGTGNDYLNGGPGSDTYVFAQGDGNDTIDDTRNASWINSIQLGAGMTQQNTFITTSANGLDIVVGFVDSSDTISIRFMNISMSNGVDQIKFADGSSWSSADIMARRTAFTAGDDTITGTSGNETLYGGDGNDTLLGLAGNDSLAGGTGDDTLTGGAGNDVLNGGSGNDTAVFAGLRNDYQLTTSGGSLSIADLAPTTNGDDGTDQLIGVETAQFSDQSVSLASPVILDLDGNGVTLADKTAGARFDWNGDGVADRTGWTTGGDGFLALDRDGDGKVSGANELSFVNDKPGARSDLDGLSAFDTNHDGRLSATDDEFAKFGVWVDANGNGIANAGEFKTLSDAGIASIGLGGTPTERSWGWDDNLVLNTGSFQRTDGSNGAFADVALNYDASHRNVGSLPASGSVIGKRGWLWRQFDRPRAVAPIKPLLGGDVDELMPAWSNRQAALLAEHIAAFAPAGADAVNSVGDRDIADGLALTMVRPDTPQSRFTAL